MKTHEIQKIDGKTCVSFFDDDLYYKIYKIRSKSDSPYFFDYNKWADISEGHPLLNRELHDNKTGKDYVVQGVYREFYEGYYVKILIRDQNNSHGVRYIENISCISDIILKGILESKKDLVWKT